MKKLWITLVLALLGFGVWSIVVRMVRVLPSSQRVAIAAMGRDLDSPVSSDFSNARYFLIVDLASLKVRAIRNPYAGRQRPVGLRTGELLLDDKVGVVLARGVRPGAANCLRARGIRVVAGGDQATARQALDRYLQAQPVAQTGPVGATAIPAALPVAAVPPELLPELGLALVPRGDGSALVASVMPGSRASMAGLLPGDVLVAVGNVAMTGTQDLRNRLAPGQIATLTLVRNNVLLTTRI